MSEKEMSYQYQVDQKVSVNCYFETEIAGETVKFQLTNRHGATPEQIAATVRAQVQAFIGLRNEFPRPAAQPAPEAQTAQIQMRTEEGLPVVDPDGKPVMAKLPEGHHLFTVKEVYHDTNRDGDKHMLKVVIDEQYEFSNGKYGISVFRPNGFYEGWKNWEKGKRYAPQMNASKVIVRDPKEGSKYADVVEFRAA